MKSLALHWKILIGMLAGVTFGFIMLEVDGADFVASWIKPLGTIFVKLIKANCSTAYFSVADQRNFGFKRHF